MISLLWYIDIVFCELKCYQDFDFLVIFPTAGMTVDLVPVADTVREATAVGLTTPGLVPVTWGRESHLLFLFFSSEKKEHQT